MQTLCHSYQMLRWRCEKALRQCFERVAKAPARLNCAEGYYEVCDARLFAHLWCAIGVTLLINSRLPLGRAQKKLGERSRSPQKLAKSFARAIRYSHKDTEARSGEASCKTPQDNTRMKIKSKREITKTG